MRKIRKGKDIVVRWSIFRNVDGSREPYSIDQQTAELRIMPPVGEIIVADEVSINGNEIIWTFRGKNQVHPGIYNLILVEKDGKAGMLTVDTCKAFALVSHSCEETPDVGGDIVTEAVMIEGEVAFAPIQLPGESYDDTELREKIAEQDEKLTELSAEVSEETTIREEQRIDLLTDTAFNAYGLKLGDSYTTASGSSQSGTASNRISVKEGEIYHLKGRGNKYAHKGYFVVNQDNVVIQIIGDNVEYNLDLTMGENAKYLFVNIVTYNEETDGVWQVKSESLKDAVLKMRDGENADTIIDTIDLSNKIVVGYAYNLGGNSVGQKYTSTPSTSATSAYARIAVNPNSKYEIRGEGSKYAYRFYAFLDADLTILELSTDAYNTRNDALVLTPPSNAAILIVNFTNYNADLDSIIRKDTYDVAESINAVYKPMIGKSIVCFGDSITQFANSTNMRYSDYLEEIGASVVNVGIGGTQIRQRATPSANPTSVEQAYGGLDIASLVNAAASNDYSIVEASASYIQSNATPQYNPIDVIEKLKSIDWNKVGIVTILGGTNDWNNGNNLGEATDENATSTLGALNHIIKTLLTAYPHLRVYVFTPLVRYVASSLAERTDATWAGTMTNGEDKTILDYVDAIKYVAENNCIPVCDMYRTLGWNKWNFSQYFNDSDGVHPYKGFKQIADRMQSFILANL